MKVNKTLVIGALGFGLVGLTSVRANFVPNQGTQAYTVIHLTGSTAFRGATYKAVVSVLGGENACHIAAYKANALNAIATGYTQQQTAKYMNIYGSPDGGTTWYLVKCAWSGSEAGYFDVVNSATSESFMDDTEPEGDLGSPVIGTGNPTVALISQSSVDLAMADNSLSFSRNKGATLAQNVAIGVIPFVYAKNAQWTPNQVFPYTAISNISHAQIRTLVKNGFIQTAQLVGDGTATSPKYVYLAGRNFNSGTRVNHLLNAGLATTFSEKQTTLSGTDGNPLLSALSSASLAGQDSGGTLATTMALRGSATNSDTIAGLTGWYAIAYLGLPDASGAANANGGVGAVFLNLAGVTESTTAIQQGQYTYWGTEYISESTSANAAAQNLFNLLVPGGASTVFDAAITANLEISLGSMQCSRSTDAADPVHNP
jgi:hypothetical protein